MFYIYCYYHPITKTPFYIGKGKGNRKYHHWWRRKHHSNNLLRAILQECDDLCQLPIIKDLYVSEDEQDVLKKEVETIKLIGRLDLGTGSLCNKTTGGEGFGNTGTKWSPTQRQKNQEYKKNNPTGQSYDQYDLNGNFIKQFVTSMELREAGFSGPQIMRIRKCVKGEGFSASGFRWSYHGTSLPNVKKGIPVNQLDKKTKQVISTFVTIGEAARQTNTWESDIARCVRGEQKSAGGFIWQAV